MGWAFFFAWERFEIGRGLGLLTFLFARSHLLSDPYRIATCPSRMVSGVGIFGVHGVQ